jgi:molecular chaperone GrpE
MSRKKERAEDKAGKLPEAEAAPEADDLQAGAAAGDPTASLEAERDDLLARLQRVSADYVNYQKRAARDVEQAREFANEGLIRDLLPVLDDMERALEAARKNHSEDDPLLRGMQMVHDKAMACLGKSGLTPIQAEGETFDPERHAAMLQEPSGKFPPMTVIRELQKGYVLKGRTIRPSAVVVAAPPEEAPGSEQAEQPADEGEDDPAEREEAAGDDEA